ncbi:hypothetical protein JW835_14015 [bacterium]|nr:hypothetical protein [bacterium]
MSLFKKLMRPVIEHSVAIMDEEEKEALFERLIDRMLNEMEFQETLQLLDKLMSGLFENLTDRQKLQFLLHVLPKFTESLNWERMRELLGNSDSTNQKPEKKQRKNASERSQDHETERNADEGAPADRKNDRGDQTKSAGNQDKS